MPTKKSCLQLAEDFTRLQDERVRTYATLSEAHKKYLGDRNFEAYKVDVASATDKFKDISSQIIAVRDHMVDEELAALVTRVQEEEEKKLKVTVDLQLARQRVQDCPPDEEDLAREGVRKLLREMNDIISEINGCMEDLRYRHAELQEAHDQDQS